MEKAAPTPLAPEKSRLSTDFFGAFCFVVLIGTVAYASLTAV